MSTAHNDLARRSTEGASDPEKGSDSVEQLEYTNIAGVPVISPEDDKRVLRKIDFRLLPIFCAIYALQFLDKTALTYTSVMGLMYETKVNTAEYSWLSSIFCESACRLHAFQRCMLIRLHRPRISRRLIPHVFPPAAPPAGQVYRYQHFPLGCRRLCHCCVQRL